MANKVSWPFEREEPGDFADDDVVGREAEAGAEGGIVLGGEIGLERKAAEDAGVLFGAPDAGGQVLLRHRVGDGDEMGGDAGGALFGGAEERVGQAPLKRTERRAVNGVDDDRHAGAGRGEAAEDAGFAAVGVDEVGPPRAEQIG